MTNSKFILIFALLLLAISPASAALINITVIGNVAVADSIGTEFRGNSFLYTAVAPNVIQELKLTSYGDNIPTTATLTRNDGSTITIQITTKSTGAVSGWEPIKSLFRQQDVSISGGTSSTETVLGFLYPVNRIFFAQSNDTPRTYYLIVADLSNFIDANAYAYDLDTSTDAYITLSERPSDNPVRKVAIVSNGGTFSGTLYYTDIQKIVASETDPAKLGESESRDLFWLIRQIGSVIDAILSFVISVASFVTTVGGLVIFVMGAKVFLTIIAAYTIIAAILSIHDSDNMFKSIGKFIGYELKLFRLFIEMFNWMKNIIVWW